MNKFWLFGALLIGATTFQSCKEKGCTDATATNYNESAKKDDGSCTYAPTTPTNEITIDSKAKFQMTMDGTAYEGPNGILSTIGYYAHTSYSNNPVEVFSSGGYFEDYNTYDIYFGVLHHSAGAITGGVWPEYDASMFTPGAQIFYNEATPSVVNNTFEVHASINDVYYNSRWGDNQSSTFEIIESKDAVFNGYDVVRVLVNVNCKVYNADIPGDYKTITNAKALIMIEK